jgi:membrane protein YdbS with pleckstrin-like domain
VHDPGATPGSVWALKPWWCQPWSILLTGLAIVAGSWFVLHLWWLSTGVSLVIGVWWLLFLVLMPAAWKRSQAGGGNG